MQRAASDTAQLRIGRLASIGKPVNIGTRGAFTARVALLDSASRVTAYVKRIDGRELCVELVCAMLGRSLGLPVPEPLLVLIPPRYGGPALAAGSVALPYPNLSAAIDREDPAVEARLAKWPVFVQSACFDEWIYNVDRNTQNLLFDGIGFHLIDHGRALSPDALCDQQNEKNYLMQLAAEMADDAAILRGRILGVMQAFASHDAGRSARVRADELATLEADISSLLSFLGARQAHLHTIGCRSVIHLQPGLW